ncbi:MAG: SH3 domain-containing protein [Clostridia bacterium]|nr:SH3 domain-containing protein [Clostridia bacterium]
MKRMARWLAALLLVCILVSGAAAESVRIVTPGGSVKLRKSGSDKARLVTNVPNYTLVELLEEGEEWSEIKYKSYTGFVKTEFLRLPSALPGKTVCPDEGTLLLRESPDEAAAPVGIVSPEEHVTVLSVEEDWAKVRAEDGLTAGAEGYIPVLSLSWQRETAGEASDWIPEPAILMNDGDLRLIAEEDSEVVAHLEAEQELTVASYTDSSCLVLVNGQVGYLSLKQVSLLGIPEEDKLPADESGREKAEEKAAAALKKRYKAFKNEKLYTEASLQNGQWHIGYYSDSGQYRYTALVNAENNQVTFTADYTGFVSSIRGQTILPKGQLEVTLSAVELTVGQVLDAEAAAWEGALFAWQISLDGKKLADTDPGEHFAASFKPRKAGTYELTVAAYDEKKEIKKQTVSFTVTESEEPAEAEAIYSQKDGSWKSVAYRDRDLEQSGCAIFTLAHALHRMGFEGENTEPAALAKAYSLCLTQTGTNNERLIRTAAGDFGFTTRSALIGDAGKIASRLREGQMFSFAIVAGHIALIDGISEDGTMVHVVDSSPSATFERLGSSSLYLLGRTGTFAAVESLDEIPGARWYPETDSYGGLEYWIPLKYVAARGVRVIQPAAASED